MITKDSTLDRKDISLAKTSNYIVPYTTPSDIILLLNERIYDFGVYISDSLL